ncbi:MAG: cupin domain-containing protein, partial [Planctomycetes bacterium]|nr:cupin domain-containing protein [Planctomycetota bacterium]
LLAAQQGPPPAVEWRVGADAEQAAAKATPWVPMLSRSTLSVGRYRLKAGSRDGQSPHDRDEVYFVVSGKGSFTAAGETRELRGGDLVFVAGKATHHFHDITEDLDLLVMFSDAVPTTGGMIAGPKPTEQTPYPETSARGSTRIFYWFGPDSAGQVAIDFGRPRWNGRYGTFLGQPSGRRWRFGENFWTTLDTNMALTLGGVEVPVGGYYCVLQNDPEHGLQLVLLDPDVVRAQRLDAYEANKTTGGILVPLQKGEAKVPAGRLEVELTVDRERRDTGRMRVRFGSNELTAALRMHPHRG